MLEVLLQVVNARAPPRRDRPASCQLCLPGIATMICCSSCTTWPPFSPLHDLSDPTFSAVRSIKSSLFRGSGEASGDLSSLCVGVECVADAG